MKIMIVLTLLMSSMAWGEEAKTECPWMREMNKRNNPKHNLVSQQSKAKSNTKLTIRQ